MHAAFESFSYYSCNILPIDLCYLLNGNAASETCLSLSVFYFLLFSNFGFLTSQVFLSVFRLRVFVFSHIFALSQRTRWKEAWLRVLILFPILLLIQRFNYLMNFLQSLYCLLVMTRLVTWVSFLHLRDINYRGSYICNHITRFNIGLM